MSDSRFILHSVEIFGFSKISPEEIYILSELSPGKNLFLQNKEKAIENISTLDQVADVRIKTVFPDRLEIIVQEHEPSILINYDKLYGLSEEKVIIPFDTPGSIPDLPVLSAFVSSDKPCAYKKLEDPVLDEILSFVTRTRTMFPSFFDQVSELRYNDSQGIMLHMIPDGLLAVIGDGDNFDKKVLKLNQALSQVHEERDRITKIDLRYEDRAILSYHSNSRG